MHGENLDLPSRENLLRTLETLSTEFQPKKVVYLDARGNWEENPVDLLQRTSNEFLFQTWKLEPEKRAALSESILQKISEEQTWRAVKRIKLALIGESWEVPETLTSPGNEERIFQFYSSSGRELRFIPSLITLDVLTWTLHLEALRLNAESFVPEWENEAKIHRQEAAAELHKWHAALSLPGNDQVMARTLSSFRELWQDFDCLSKIPRHKAEENKLLRILSLILEKASIAGEGEEIFAIAAEKIQPPQGIVTETSPALLLPCLRILNDEQIPVSSGLPYKASVILSILQDPRSTEALLQAMDRIPLQFTKIRENLIYALGSLKEEKAVDTVAAVLKASDEAHYENQDGEKYSCLLLEQKEEAFWALGKIGEPSVRSLPILTEYSHHSSPRLRTYLARALGEIGKAQKERHGGVSVEILIALLRLMQAKHRNIFEETVSALRKIEMPQFIHTLYLYRAGAVTILGLTPAQRGLYELSETLHHLLKSKKRVVMAVNGDSGTGKTYFCQSLISGFGDLEGNEILYLMRDRKRDQKVFNRILGLKWLKKFVEPSFYENYPVREEKDDPDAFLTEFFKEHSKKRLFILDGCRDQCYFQRVIELLYFKGELDVEVNFRATLSTRRLNLEEREIALESVRTHLDFFEEPALEDTLLYQEGIAILYDLDNSVSSRLNRKEIQELFQKPRIQSWGDLIKIGDFAQSPKTLQVKPETLSLRKEKFSWKEEKWPGTESNSFRPDEKKFKFRLNEDLAARPNLLQTAPVNEIEPKQIKFYAQDQIAGIGESGHVFVITFLDNRIFYTQADMNSGIHVSGRDIFVLHPNGEISLFSFERNERIRLGITDNPALVIKSLARDKIVTGHADGKIRIWDFSEKRIRVCDGHAQPVISLAADYQGRIYSGSLDRSIRQWDWNGEQVSVFSEMEETAYHLKLYPRRKILATTSKDTEGCPSGTHVNLIKILDFENGRCLTIPSPSERIFSSVNVYFDGRIIATLAPPKKTGDRDLVVISASEDQAGFHILDGHNRETKDSLVMGPRIVTCGSDEPQSHSLRIWGTEFFVRMALSKLSLQNT